MEHNVYIYIAIVALTTYLIRVLPLTLIRKQIRNRTIRSFLYYVPFVTLAVMTFPAILYETATPISAAVALVVGIVLAFKGNDLMIVSIACCLSVFLVEMIPGI